MKLIWTKMLNIANKKYALLFCLFLIVFTAFLYRDYLTGDKVFVSTGDAMDLYDQFYPDLLNVAEYIESGDTRTQMDFSIGLGCEFSLGIPTIYNIVSFFGIDRVAYLMGIVQMIKIILAGIFSYFYFITMGKNHYIASICSISYSFCGHMLIRQWWLSYATEVVVLVIWLLCFELWMMRKDKRWLPLGTFFLIINLSSVYYVLLYTLLMISYILFRYLYEGRINELKKTGKDLFATVICIAIFTYGIEQFASGIISSVSSDRFSSGVTSTSQFGNFWANLGELFTLFSRTVGINILGCGKCYVGELDYLTAPTFYIGILCLLVLIPVWFEMKKSNKVLIFIVGFITCVYIFINPLRRIVNGYADESFKISSFWILVIYIYIVAQGLESLLRNMKRYQLFLIFAEVSVIEIVGAWALVQDNWLIDKKMMLFTMGMAIAYLLVLEGNYFLNNTKAICRILLMLGVIEAGIQANYCLQNMSVLSVNSLAERTLYNDYTNEVLGYLKTRNARQDYRINKQYFSYRYNDAWAQGYYGTSFYMGGIGAGANIIRLYDMLKLPTAGAGYKYAYGTSPYTEINTLLGVKYILSRYQEIMNYGYDVCYLEHDIYALENQYQLSLGYGYDSYMSYDEYLKMDIDSRRKCLINACVVEGADVEQYGNVDCVNSQEMLFDIQKYSKYKIEPIRADGIYWVPHNSEEDVVLVIDASFDVAESEYRANLKYLAENNWVQYQVRVDSEEKQLFEINASGVSAFGFYYSDGKSLLPVDQLECYIIPQGVYYGEYTEGTKRLRKSELKIQEFSGRYISGSALCDREKIFCLAIPYGNWNIYVDGEVVDTFLVNMAFIGFNIDAGEHFIEAEYVNHLTELQIILRYIIFIMCIGWIAVLSMKRKERKLCK